MLQHGQRGGTGRKPQVDLIKEMIARLGLVRPLWRRAGGTIRNADAITTRRDADMMLLARIISDPADGQVATGQAEIGLHDVRGAVQVRGRRGGADAQRDLDDIPARVPIAREYSSTPIR